ncbi:MAG: hypothetical protein ACTSW1_08815 [Candidatus Hodarchaeales archaeon]
MREPLVTNENLDYAIQVLKQVLTEIKQEQLQKMSQEIEDRNGLQTYS